MSVTIDWDFIEKHIDDIAAIFDGHFIDPNVRPKDKRVQFKEKDGLLAMREGIKAWKDMDEPAQLRYVHSVKDYMLQAIQGEFPVERARWIYSILSARPDPAAEAADAQKRDLRRRLRTEQADMGAYDMARRCLDCGKFLFMYDERNNKRHEKDEVCTCHASRGIQNKMREKTADYRKELEMKKKIRKAKKR